MLPRTSGDEGTGYGGSRDRDRSPADNPWKHSPASPARFGPLRPCKRFPACSSPGLCHRNTLLPAIPRHLRKVSTCFPADSECGATGQAPVYILTCLGDVAGLQTRTAWLQGLKMRCKDAIADRIVEEHLRSIDGVICNNITALSANRALLSQNMLSQLRNLVEGVAVLIHTKDDSTEHDYAAIEAGLAFMKTQGQFGFSTASTGCSSRVLLTTHSMVTAPSADAQVLRVPSPCSRPPQQDLWARRIAQLRGFSGRPRPCAAGISPENRSGSSSSARSSDRQ